MSTPQFDTQQLAATLGDLARTLQHETSPQQTLDAIVTAAVDTVPGAEHAGVTMVRQRRDLDSVATTSDVVREIDRRQYNDREGPCLDALWEQATVRMNDSEAEQRWPRFTTDIRGLGIRAMCCFRLFTHYDTLGALNLYAGSPDSFTDSSEEVGRVFATHAAVALADAQKIEQLEHAVDSRDIIGQAKGILMERYKITADQAFQLLVSTSQRTHVKLRDIANHLASSGQLERPS
jgi:transcriptional regulator with GAF, ATPase, and Fis domain